MHYFYTYKFKRTYMSSIKPFKRIRQTKSSHLHLSFEILQFSITNFFNLFFLAEEFSENSFTRAQCLFSKILVELQIILHDYQNNSNRNFLKAYFFPSLSSYILFEAYASLEIISDVVFKIFLLNLRKITRTIKHFSHAEAFLWK